MDDLKFFELFGEIDAELVQQANDDLNFWQESQEGIVVRAGSSRRSPLRIVFASVACAAAVFGAVFLLRNVLKNGFMYEPPVNSSDSSVQGGESSVAEIEYTLNSDVMWAIGKTVDEVAERYGGVTGGGGDDEVYQFKNGYGKLYSWLGEGGGCKVIVNVSASDLLTGDLSTVDLDNMASKYGLENFSYNLDPNQMAGPDYATASFSHPSYKNIWFVMTFKKGGFDEKGGLDDTATFYIRYYDDDEFEKILENVNKPLSRTECEDIVTLFNDWADLDYNIHPYHKINEVYIFPECVDETAFITEEVTRKGSNMTYTEYFYMIKSGDFSTEVEFDRKIGEMFSEKFKEQFMGSSSWQDFRFKGGKTFVAAFSQFDQEQPQMLLYLDLESIDENTVVVNVSNIRGSYEQKYTATLLRSENGGFKIDEVGKDDGSFNGIPWLFHYNNIQVVVNWQGETLFTFGDDLSASGGEPMFFVGPDGKAILTSEVTRLDYTDKTAETLTEEDYGAMVFCDGFAYFMEPCGIGYDNYNNPELFDGTDFIGEVPENKNEWKRAYVGDEIFGLKVKSAYSEFYIHDPNLPPYTGYHFTNSVFEFEGTLEVEGFLDIGRNYGDPNIDGQMSLFAPTVDIPLAPVYPYASGEEMYAARFEERRVHYPGDKYVCAGEHYTIQLGHLADVSCDLDGMGAGDIAYVRVTLNNIRCFENVAFATLDKVELLSDILAHDE